jgi:Tfp pilus assembly PilM family ATPase
VRRITLIGGGAKLKNLDAYLTQTLGIPTTQGDPFVGTQVSGAGSEYAEAAGATLAVAVGLALREFVA